MTTSPAASSRPVRRAALLSALFALLMVGAGVFLFIQAANGGGLLYMDNGFAVEPRDAAFALQFLAVLLLPHMLAAMRLRPARRRLAQWLAFPCSVLLLLAFPLSIEARLWSEASYSDGRPMYSSSGGERVKSWDAFFGYEPVWKAEFSPSAGWTRYEGNDLGERHTYETNGVWGKRVVYALNRNVASDRPEVAAMGLDSSGKVYECITEEMTHLLGFYWRDRRHSDVTYLQASQLPKGVCTLIDTPNVGADFR
jgi:hypothetical protein